MASFSYTVDTRPMADELNSVSRHVDNTTKAVVTMRTAVIVAEEAAANHVCNNVNKGFYTLIRSQISQKKARLQSEADSLVMQLDQQRKALLGIKGRMEKDYKMISGRYAKLFNGLNTNLQQRIFELDQPAMKFADKEVTQINNRTKYLTATIPVAQLESLAISQKIVASSVKFRALSVIRSMRSFLFVMNEQKKLTDQILIHGGRDTETVSLYIPVVICECNRDKTGSSFEISMPEVELSSLSQSIIRNHVFAGLSSVEWKLGETPMVELTSEFSKLVSTSSKSQRVKDLTMKLFQDNIYQTL